MGEQALPRTPTIPMAGFEAAGRRLENLEKSLCTGGLAYEGSPWRLQKQVTQCHHLTQHHRGMLLVSKLDISPGLGTTVTFPPLPFLGQIWYKEVSSCPAAPRQPGVSEQRGFSGRTVPSGPPGTIHLLAGLLHKYLSRRVCASTLPPAPLPRAHR